MTVDNMRIETTLSGIHPRSENLVKVSRDFDRGRASEQELLAAFHKDTKEAIETQAKSNLSKISSGQLDWEDPLRPVIKAIASGLEIGADMWRWFDTNTFYKRPKIVGELYVDPGLFESNLTFCKEAPGRSILFLPGPYTLACLAEDKHFNSRSDLVDEFSRVLSQLAGRADRLGVSCIQLNEPSLVYSKDRAEAGSEELSRYARSYRNFPQSLELRVHTHFGDGFQIIQELSKIQNVSSVGVDAASTSLTGEICLNGKSFGYGCVNSRNSLPEDPEWVVGNLSKVSIEGASGIILTPNTDLRYLPRRYADGKVRILSEVAELLRNKIEV